MVLNTAHMKNYFIEMAKGKACGIPAVLAYTNWRHDDYYNV